MKFIQYRLSFLSRLHDFLQWRKRTMSAVIVAALSPIFAHANPNGAQVISGQVSIDQSIAGITTITNSPSAIINWQDFNIAQNEITRFVQQNGQSAVLNRIIGGNPSEILGSLFSNGQVFLINPNGIVFGAGSQIDTQGLLASTLNLSNSDFQKGNFHFIAGSKSGDITNEGIIHAGKDGNIVLIAPNIENNGIIHSEGGKIVLAAGQELVLTSLDDPEIRFQVQAPKNHVLNVGQLLTEGGAINVFAGTLKHSGDISADSVEVDKQGNIRLIAKGDVTLEKDSKTSANNEKGVAGKIEITGENVAVLDNSKLSVSGQNGGGEILVGGDWQGKGNLPQATTATVESNVKINANAITDGNGGKVVVWSDVHNPKSVTTVKGEINAKGGKQGGDGGKVETSGHQVHAENAKINASAPKGKAGEWLLDPTNLTIDSAYVQGSANVSSVLTGGTTGWTSTSGFQTCSGGSGGAACIDTTNPYLQFSWTGGQSVSKSFALSSGTSLSFNTAVDASPFGFASTGQVSLSFLDAAQAVIGSPVVSSVITTSATISQSISLTNLTIPANATAVNVTFSQLTSGNGWAGNYGMRFVSPTVTTNESAGSVLATLNSGTNFTAQTSGTGADSGDIFINSPITWATNTTLTFSAHRNIDINSSISGFGTSSKLALEYGQGAVAAGNTGTYNVHAPVNLRAGQNFSTKLGSDGTPVNYTVITDLGVAGDATTLPATLTLQSLAHTSKLAGNYVLGTNIDASATATTTWNSSGEGFLPVGNATTPFTGKFEGLNHTITGLMINRSAANNIGLFGYTSGSIIRNVGLMNSSISGYSAVGGLIGFNDNGAILSNSYSTSSVSVSAHDAVGGLVGNNYVGSVVSDSYGRGTVYGLDGVGGLVGGNWGTISASYSNSTVSGTNTLGGLAGQNVAGVILNSYSTGGITGTGLYIGGLLGGNYSGTVSNSYSTGAVSGSSSVGGLIGNNTGTVNNSFWDTQTSGQATSAGGTGLTTAQMMTQSNLTGFDFTNTWWMSDTNTRPFLRSEWSTNITNAHQLQLMASNLSASYTLANNLDLSAELSNASRMWDTTKGFVPVGVYAIPFTGNFDGLNHTISNLKINRSTMDYVGLFGAISGGSIKDVGLISENISGRDIVGGLVASNSSGTVNNSYSTGVVTGALTDVGGLVGSNFQGTISNSYSSTTVQGSYYVGGLVGWNNSATIAKSYSTGAVSGTNSVGGLVGGNASGSGTVIDSYSTGNVSGTDQIGGLVGLNTWATVSNSYSIGAVTGTTNVGGLVGVTQVTGSYGTVNNSFWDTQTSGQATSAGGTGLTTAQMQNITNFAHWDFVKNWSMTQGSSYPHLLWQGLDLQTLSGSAPNLIGKTFNYAVNGALAGNFITDSSGNFSVNSHVSVGSGNLLVWLSGDATTKAATLADALHTGLKLEPNTIYGLVDLDTATLKSAKGSLSDADIPFSFTSSSVLSPTVGILKANNNIILNNSIATNGSSISLKAGKSVLLQSSSVSSNGGDIEIIANETVANGIVNSHRDAGQAIIQMQAGSNLDAGLGVGGVAIMLRKRELDTPNNAGAITLTTVTGGNINIDNAGTYNATDLGSGDVVLNGVISTNSPTSTGKNLSISSSHDISVNAYLNTGITTSQATIGNGGNISLTAGNDILLNVTGNTLLSNVQTDTGQAPSATYTGNAGNITLTANRNITGANSDIFANVTKYQSGSTGGHGGNISLTATTGSVSIHNITTDAFQNDTGGTIGRGGDVSITSGTDLSVNGIHALSYGATYNYGNATTLSGGGNVLLDAGQNLTIPASGYIDTRTVNQGSSAATINDASGTVTLKAKGDIVLNSNTSILTSNDAVVLNSDTDQATNSGGAIVLNTGSSITTNGGAITLGGGTNPLTSYAQGNATNISGILLSAALNSSGGDITLHGKSYAGAPTGIDMYSGTWLRETSSINSGAGKILIDGISLGAGNSTAQGTTFNPGSTVTSSNSTADAIIVSGSHTGYSTGTSLGLNVDGTVQASNGGGITLTGSASSNTVGTSYAYDLQVYAPATITSSTGAIALNADTLNLTGTLQSSGSLTIQPRTANTTIGIAGATGTLQLPTSYFTTNFVNGFSNINIGSATAGDISVGTTALTYNDPLILKTAGSIILASNAALTGSVGGNNSLTLWSSAGSNYAGNITLNTGSSITTNGGDVLFRGGTGALTTVSNPIDSTSKTNFITELSSTGAGKSVNHGINLIGSTINAGGGNIEMRAASNYVGIDVVSASAIRTSGAGNIALYGLGGLAGAVSATHGIHTDTATIETTGTGNLTMYGVNDQATGGGNPAVWLVSSTMGTHGTTSGDLSITGYSTESATSATSTLAWNNEGVTVQSSTVNTTTAAGSINIVGHGGTGNKWNMGVKVREANSSVSLGSSSGTMTVTGIGGTCTLVGSCWGIVAENNGSFVSQGTGSINLIGTGGTGAGTDNYGIKYNGTVASHIGSNTMSGNITLVSDSIDFGTLLTLQSTGALIIAPKTTVGIGISGGTGALQIPSSYFATNFVNGFSNINIGSATTGAITLGGALTVPTSANLTLQNASDMALNGALTLSANKTLTLNSTGNVTQTAPISATNLLLLGAGNYALTNLNNVIANLAANGVGNLNFVNSTAFAIDSVAGTNGINATGTVDISTYNGNLTVNQPVLTSNATANALKLNAGSIETTSTTANILVGVNGSFSVGTGGIAKFFTGSILGSTGLSAFIPVGNSRYNSDESVSNYTATITAAGKYAIYREQPILHITPNAVTSVYGDALATISGTVKAGEYMNGDTSASLTGTPVFTTTATNTSHVGNYDIAYVSGYSSAVGYGFADDTVSVGEYSVTARLLTPTLINTAVTKTYDGTTAAPAAFTPTYNFIGYATGDSAAVLTHSSAIYDSKDVATATKVTVSGLALTSITGNGAISDYALDATSKDVAATIAAKALSITAAPLSKTYGAIDPTLTYMESGLISGDTLSGGLTRVAGENVGEYVISSTLANPNYAISYTPANFAIIKSAAQIAAEQQAAADAQAAADKAAADKAAADKAAVDAKAAADAQAAADAKAAADKAAADKAAADAKAAVDAKVAAEAKAAADAQAEADRLAAIERSKTTNPVTLGTVAAIDKNLTPKEAEKVVENIDNTATQQMGAVILNTGSQSSSSANITSTLQETSRNAKENSAGDSNAKDGDKKEKKDADVTVASTATTNNKASNAPQQCK